MLCSKIQFNFVYAENFPAIKWKNLVNELPTNEISSNVIKLDKLFYHEWRMCLGATILETEKKKQLSVEHNIHSQKSNENCWKNNSISESYRYFWRSIKLFRDLWKLIGFLVSLNGRWVLFYLESRVFYNEMSLCGDKN